VFLNHGILAAFVKKFFNEKSVYSMHLRMGSRPPVNLFSYSAGTINGWCDDTEKIADINGWGNSFSLSA
jgi:hypothetical protein